MGLVSFGDTSKFYDKKWNVLVPLDTYGVEECGSWWLGEKGDFFVKELLHALIDKIRLTTGTDRGLYIWGSSMGGFGALLHGILLNAKAVYANIPQIKLLGTNYSNTGMKKYFEPIFKTIDENEIFNDVTNFLNKKEPEKNPLFFITQSRFDYPQYMDNHSLYFFNKCKEFNINVSLNIVPVKGHKVLYPVHESLALIENFVDINEVDIKYKNKSRKNNIVFQTGELILKEKIFKIKGTHSIYLENINWKENPYNNRTWMWHLHQMSFIEALVVHDESLSVLDGSRYALELLQSWFNSFNKDLKDVFAWHDHATAPNSNPNQLLIKPY